MQKLSIADVTLKQAAKSGNVSLSFREKIEIAKLLNKIHVSVIELPAIVKEKTDMLLVKSISSSVTASSIIAVPVNLSEGDVERVAQALSAAKKPRIQIEVPTSTVQMEYICGKKPAAMLQMIADLTKRAKALCDDIEFIADDATRSEPDFLYKAIETAIENGATTVTLCDTAGKMFPEDISALISDLYKSVPAAEGISVGIQCGNELEMATAGSVSAIKAGANEVKVSSVPSVIAPSMESICQIIKNFGDEFGYMTGVRTTEYHKAAKQISWIVNARTSKGLVSEGMTLTSEDFSLSEHDDITEVSKAITALGYELSAEDISNVYTEFKRISGKKTITAKELDAIVASTALQVPTTYFLESYVINSGNIIPATANITVKKNGETIRGLCGGDGPIDAAFHAIEQIIGHHYELDDFQIQSVTEGQEAVGSAVVKLRSNGKLYSGKGLSTDIIGASIRAYLNALNKIVYEEA